MISQSELKSIESLQVKQDKLRSKVRTLLRIVGNLDLVSKIDNGKKFTYHEYKLVLMYAKNVGKPVPDNRKGSLLNALKYYDSRFFNSFGQQLK